MDLQAWLVIGNKLQHSYSNAPCPGPNTEAILTRMSGIGKRCASLGETQTVRQYGGAISKRNFCPWCEGLKKMTSNNSSQLFHALHTPVVCRAGRAHSVVAFTKH